ncbi:hypothetical protein PYW07_016223 [Mythimna separata]|uniref:Uncharacterized protein n=1 Tax=Mythimna separata TaxID=271217 RepID=A0AAD7YS78_MYTSE|nr:hypothetical protein PYW07_016223 [Mythimna separata]
MHVVFYEYLHNEFRRSFPEAHYHLCDLIHKDPYIGAMLRAAGMRTCPIQPGIIDLRNMSFHQVNFPSVWPFEKERAAVTYINKQYFEDNAVFNVRRYKRGGDYYVNAFLQIKVVLNNTIMMHVVFYEYLHNEFRRSFPEAHFHICDLIHKDPYMGAVLRAAGMRTCPLQPGVYDLRNMSFHQVNFPSVWPFEKGMCEFTIKDSNDLMMAQANLVLTFIPENRLRKL